MFEVKNYSSTLPDRATKIMEYDNSEYVTVDV